MSKRSYEVEGDMVSMTSMYPSSSKRTKQPSDHHAVIINYLNVVPAVRSSLFKYIKTHPGLVLDQGQVTLALVRCIRNSKDRQKIVREIIRQLPNIRRFRTWAQHVPSILEDVTLSRKLVEKCSRLYDQTAFIENVQDFEQFLFATDLKLNPDDPARSLFLSPAIPMLPFTLAMRVWDALDRPELTNIELYRAGLFVHICTKWSVDTQEMRCDPFGRNRRAWTMEVTSIIRNTFGRLRDLPYSRLYQNLLRWMHVEKTIVFGEAISRRGDVFFLDCWERVQSDVITLLQSYMSQTGDTTQSVSTNGDCCICLDTVGDTEGDTKGDTEGDTEGDTKDMEGKEGIELDCRHVFHRACIESWNTVTNTCPLCRALFTLKTSLPTKWGAWTKPAHLNAQQLQAAENCVRYRFSIVTGAGGTGKTEVAAVLGQYITWLMQDEFQFPSVCVAPSGKATEVLKTRLGVYKDAFKISTIHRWILGNKGACVPFLFVDEASMVDIWTTWHVLQSARLRGVQHIVLFGDPQQLAPVDNRGTILDAFLSGGTCRLSTSLTANFRSTPGLLSLLENLRQVTLHPTRVLQKEWFTTSNSILCTVPNDDEDALYASILENLRGTDPTRTRIIVNRKAPIIDRKTSPQRETFLLAVHNFFNPGSPRHYVAFCVGDIVRSTVNILDEIGEQLIVANGSEGTVTSVSPLSVCFQGRLFEQGDDNTISVREMFDRLEWGTISTVHKFQGSEAHTIIAVFLGDYRDHNTIQLLYTAASRARQKLIVIMEQKNLSLYCTRPGRVFRNTTFNASVVHRLQI